LVVRFAFQRLLKLVEEVRHAQASAMLRQQLQIAGGGLIAG